jgi:hypothetical protein
MKPCPVSNTCPSINEAIRILSDAMGEINESVKLLEQISNETDFTEIGDESIEGAIDDAKWNADTAHSRLSDVSSLLEDLRDENAKLREWGEDLCSEVEELEKLLP